MILPLRIDDVLPEAALAYYLGTPHWLDAITKPFEAHLEKLADACASLLAVTGRASQDVSGDGAPAVAARATATMGAPDPRQRVSLACGLPTCLHISPRRCRGGANNAGPSTGRIDRRARRGPGRRHRHRGLLSAT